MKLNTDKMLVDRENNVGWITFNNPAKRNAVSLEMWQALGMILEDLQADDDVRVVIMKGAGNEAFVSGADISEFEVKRSSAEQSEEYTRVAASSLKMLNELAKPLLAMIQGYCVGGGLAAALSADVRIATDDSKFGIPAAKLGLGYAYEGVAALADIVGPSYALDILMSGRLLDADEALRIGLVNRIVIRDDLEKTVKDYAAIVVANAPLTIKAVKASIKEYLKDPGKRNLGKISQMVKACFDSNDYKEGRRAFMEKRKPRFTGK
ncbi:MAG: enoyl-CoA hydratase/isomerase family protein [Deltaproteobacteria bacterium]|nr:enoyl-CoA hydratase/isomerase family protein [Deltaproteobacteria bacterium]